MAISYTLSIIQTLLYPAGSFPSDDYLGGVMWQMTGTDGVNSSSKQGLARFDVVQTTDSYTPFKDLSQETIIGWTQDVIGESTLATIKSDIANDLASKS